jgi:hypothetical protein
MNPLKFISDIFKPAADLVDNLHTSEDEKGKLRVQLDSIATDLISKYIELESKYLQAQSSIIQAEANGQSSLQRNWRPVTMLIFVSLVVFDSYGWLPNRLAPEALDIIKIGLGGYVVGRSAEKVVDKWKQS